MSKSLSRKLTIYYFVMSILIVMYHISIYNNANINFSSLLDKYFFVYLWRFFDIFAVIALGFFFSTSAFLLYLDADTSNVNHKIVKRLKSLGIPFLIWNFIEFLFLLFQNGFNVKWVGNLLLRMSFDPFDGPLWYVFALLILTFLAPIIIKIRKLGMKKVAIAFILITLSCYIFSIILNRNLIINEFYWIERVVRYIPAYLLGIFIAWYGKSIYTESYSIAKVEFISRSIGIIIVIALIIVGTLEENILSFLACRILPICVWFSFHCKKEDKITFFPIKISFMLFVMHDLCIRVVGWIFYKFFTGKLFSGAEIILIRIGTLIFVYLIVLLFSTLVKKISPKLYKLLTGGR